MHCHRFANALQGLGVRRASAFSCCSGGCPELYFALLGGLMARCVVSPLFSAFGPEPIATRCEMGDARAGHDARTLPTQDPRPASPALPGLRHVILAGAADPELLSDPGVQGWSGLVDAARRLFDRFDRPEDMALLHFTSGTTGKPKCAVHVHGAVLAHLVTGRYALDPHADDIFWCTADPGWITGTSYGVLAPQCNGASPAWWSRPSSTPRPGMACSSPSASASGTPRRPPSA